MSDEPDDATGNFYSRLSRVDRDPSGTPTYRPSTSIQLKLWWVLCETPAVQFCVLVEPHNGATYADQRRVALAAEALGFVGFFRADHLIAGAGDGLPGPTETWATLAALSVQTETIRIGSLMTCATFRHPSLLATAVAQVDEMSGGRVEFGFGAGWWPREHAATGIDFPEVHDRFDRFAEQLEIIHGLGHPYPPDLHVHRPALLTGQLTRATQANAGRRSADHHHRRGWEDENTGAGGPVGH